LKYQIILLAIFVAMLSACADNYKESDFSIGTAIYNADSPDCKQALLNGKPIPGVFLKKIEKTNGTSLQGIACHGVSIVIDPKTGVWKEGSI